ncbi:hypothetical protein TNCV_1222221 [Trichonephila clavipes]|nr:hypothetical protein TNCV_1222221 [Trichonephila clavipes]
MTTESFRKGRFTVAALSDDELPEGFLESKVHYMPRAVSGQQSQLPSSEFHLRSVDSPSGSSTQEVAGTVASVESSTEYSYVEPIIHVIHPAGIQISTSSGDVPMEITPEQAFFDNGAKQQAALFFEEIGCIEEIDEDYIPSRIKRESESGKFQEIPPDAQTSLTNESISPLLDVSGVIDNGSQRQSMVCFGRHGESYINFVKEFRNSIILDNFREANLEPVHSSSSSNHTAAFQLFQDGLFHQFDLVSKFLIATPSLHVPTTNQVVPSPPRTATPSGTVNYGMGGRLALRAICPATAVRHSLDPE